jgi:eukaryotic-like serine/threonine-protein kinase
MVGNLYRAGQNGCSHSLLRPDQADGLLERLLDAVLAEQRSDWIAGKRIPADETLRQHPELADEPACAAELIYHEFSLRQELGESPDWQQHIRQHPEHAALLERLRRADQLVEQTLAAPAQLPAGIFAGYDLLEEVGRGGMGVVFKARHKSLDRIVALKVLRSDGTGEERKRLDREAQAVARLQHPNIVQVYEVGETAGGAFVSLEFVDGQSLAYRLHGTPLPARRAAALVKVLAGAMHYAHERGVIHRDLKPANVLLAGTPETPIEDCIAKVADFGLAKKLDTQGDTHSGAVLGTPSYMAPEQAEARSAAVDRRTDVYGLGAILYELLTGRPPFRADTPLQTLKQVVEAEPARPRLLNAAVPRDLETVCLKCLQKEPPRRYPSAAALADDLRRFVQGEPVRARSIGALGRGRRWCRRKPALAALSAVLVLAVLGGLAGILFQWRRAEVARREVVAGDGQIRQLLADLVQASPMGPTGFYSLGSPRIEPLLKAEEHCKQLLEKDPTDTAIRIALTNVYGRLGRLNIQRGSWAKAHSFFSDARSLWQSLPDTARSWESRDWLATTAYWQAHSSGWNEALPSQWLEAVRLCQSADALWQELAEEQPGNLSVIGKATRNSLEALFLIRVRPAQVTLRRDPEDDVPLLERLVLDDPPNRVKRKRLAFKYLLLGDFCRERSHDEARRHWHNAYKHYQLLAETRSDDLSVNLMLAFCCSRLMEKQAQDPYYVRVVPILERIGTYLAELDNQQPDSDWLSEAQLETYCCLVICHANAGGKTLAEETCRNQVQPLVAKLIDQQAGPEHALGLVNVLSRLADVLCEAKLNAAGLLIARKGAALNSSYAGFPTRDLGFNLALAANAEHLAEVLHHLRDLSPSLQQANLARRLYEQATAADPNNSHWRIGLTMMWARIAKVRWDLGQADESLAAFQESARIQRQLFEADSSSAYHRYNLDRCYGRLAYWSTLKGDWAGTAAALLKREKLWPDDSDRLMRVSRDFMELAEEMARGPKSLSAEEQTARQHYLAESERTRQAALAAARRQKHNLKADG